MVLPVAVGIASAGIFAIFPSKRNGLGYAPSGEKEEEETKKDAGSAWDVVDSIVCYLGQDLLMIKENDCMLKRFI